MNGLWNGKVVVFDEEFSGNRYVDGAGFYFLQNSSIYQQK